MYRGLVRNGLAPALLVLGLGGSGAAAFPAKPISADAVGVPAIITPAAMCGYSCRGGGRYIPGPPSVCAENGLSYCGSSRDSGTFPGGPPFARGRGWDDEPRRRGCRTITIERDDGSVRRVTRCD
ncbi:MAG: hypothetical protein ACJ8E5_15600 [Xanthobacteraceae bacterium]